jgi:hypothetical protein
MKYVFLIFVIILIFIYCFFPKNFIIDIKNFTKIAEKFEGDNPQYSFIGIDANDASKLVFYHPKNTESDKYYRFSSPDNQGILQVIYQNGLTIILTNSKKIYYCNNCNFVNKTNIDWKPIETLYNGNRLNIKSIGYDDISKKLFLLTVNGMLLINDYMMYGGVWQPINLPSEDKMFLDFDAHNGYVVGVGSYTKFVYLGDVLKIKQTPVPWTILDKSKIINKVKITKHGILGKKTDNDLFLCIFPCDGKANEKWTLINDEFSSNINATSEIISLVRENSLFVCDKTCNLQNKPRQISFTNDIKLSSGSVIDYIIPDIEPRPTVNPFDPSLAIKINTELTKSIDSQNKIKETVVGLGDKIEKLSSKTTELNKKLLESESERKQTVDDLMGSLGLQNPNDILKKLKPTNTPSVEKFVNPVPTQPVSEFSYLGVSLKELSKQIKDKTTIKKPIVKEKKETDVRKKKESVIIALGT